MGRACGGAGLRGAGRCQRGGLHDAVRPGAAPVRRGPCPLALAALHRDASHLRGPRLVHRALLSRRRRLRHPAGDGCAERFGRRRRAPPFRLTAPGACEGGDDSGGPPGRPRHRPGRAFGAGGGWRDAARAPLAAAPRQHQSPRAPGGRRGGRHRGGVQRAAGRHHVRDRGADAAHRNAQQRAGDRGHRAGRPDRGLGVRQLHLFRRHPGPAAASVLHGPCAAGDPVQRPAGRLLLAAAAHLAGGPVGSIQPLARALPGALRRGLRPGHRPRRLGQRGRHLRQRLFIDAPPARRPPRHAGPVRDPEAGRHLAGHLVGRAWRAVRTLAGDRCGYRRRRRPACGRGCADARPHRARDGRLPGRGDAGPDHGIHHRHGNGRRPRHGPEPDGGGARRQPARARAGEPPVRRAGGGAAGEAASGQGCSAGR